MDNVLYDTQPLEMATPKASLPHALATAHLPATAFSAY
jgi:hypothetical protein